MSNNDSSGFREIREEFEAPSQLRVFKREKSVEFNDATLSEEEEFLGFGDISSDGPLFTQSSIFSSNAPTLSVLSDPELDSAELASSASDIGSAIFDHDYISTQDFQENIQMAMRRSDSSEDQGIRQLLYDDDGIKFNVQDIEGRFKLLLNISSSILNSRSAEQADQSTVNSFLNKLCEQTESLKTKFSTRNGLPEDDPQTPGNDSGRASKTPPSMEDSGNLVAEDFKGNSVNNGETHAGNTSLSDIDMVEDTEAPGTDIVADNEPEIELSQENPATCLDEKSLEEYTEIMAQVDAIAKIGTDVVSSMEDLRKTLPLSVAPEILSESREVLKKKLTEMQAFFKAFAIDLAPQVEIGIQTEEGTIERDQEEVEQSEIPEEKSRADIGIQTCDPEEEIPGEDPVASAEDVPADDEEIKNPEADAEDSEPPEILESKESDEENPEVPEANGPEDPEALEEGTLEIPENKASEVEVAEALDSKVPEGETSEVPESKELEDETLKSKEVKAETPEIGTQESKGAEGETPEIGTQESKGVEGEIPENELLESREPEEETPEMETLESREAEDESPEMETLESREAEDETPEMETLESREAEEEIPKIEIPESKEVEEDIPKIENPEQEKTSGEDAVLEDSMDKILDPGGLLTIPKVESTEIQNERMKRKLLDMLDSSSDEAYSDDDQDDPLFDVKMLRRKRRSTRRIREDSEEEEELPVEEDKTEEEEDDKERNEEEDKLEEMDDDEPLVNSQETVIQSDSESEFDILNYTISDSPEDEEEDLPEQVPEDDKVEKIPKDEEVSESFSVEEKPLKEIPDDDDEILDQIPEDLVENAEDAQPEDILMEFNDSANETENEILNTQLTSIVEETKNVMLLNNEEIPLTMNNEPAGEDQEKPKSPEKRPERIKKETSIRNTDENIEEGSDDSNMDSEDDKELPAASLEPDINLEMLDKGYMDDYFDDLNDKEIDKLLDFSTLERRRYEATKTTESKETDKPRKSEKKKDQLLDILQEVKAGGVSEDSSESSEDELTEEQFLEQCNMNMKHRLLNFSSDESEEENDVFSVSKMYKKKSGEEDDDACSISSDGSAIVDNFLMNIVQKEIADDVGGEKLSDEEANKENTPAENSLPKENAPAEKGDKEEIQEKPSEMVEISESEPVQKSPQSVEETIQDTLDDVQIVDLEEESEKEKETEDAEKAETSESRSKAPKVSGMEKIILSDKLFDGIEVRKDLMKEKIPRSLKIISSDDESEKDTRSQGDDGNECLDTSMFNKKDDTKTSEEINRLLAKYDNKTPTHHVKDTRVPSETISLSSDSDVDEVIEEEVEKEAPRRNLRAMLSDDQLEAETKRAQREEQERIKRLEKKTDSLSQRLSQSEAINQDESEIILDYHTKTKKYISVHPAIVQYLKPHQIDGVRFMYDNVYGGVDYVNQHDGSGCILAHCMGLGKTLQLIALLHTVIRYPELKTNRILVICPKTTIMNWFEEIRKWLKPVRGDISMKVFYFPDNSDLHGKLKILKEWHKSGEKGYRNAGCLLIGYEAFRVLVLKQSRKQQSLYTHQETSLIKKQITETLLEPGADLVICDEGHMIKNRKSAINQAVTKIRTKRRIILTGTPIQNNLKEYYCMVDFIKPSFLGTEREFANLYSNPIKSGQHKDSTPSEIRCMKQRSYVLHKKLSRFVQRREAAVLKQFLPEKFEYVLFIPMTPVQERLYEFFLTHNPTKEISGKSLIPDYTALRKIWTHPKVLENAWENAMLAKEKKDRARARLHPESDDEVPDDVLDKQVGAMSVLSDWWRAHLSKEHLESIFPSNKLRLIFEILKLCKQNGEKCLIFSAFVAVLNVVEYFMRKINNKDENAAKYGLTEYDGPWEHGKDFYRLDGKTPKTLRHSMVQSFNNPMNTRMRCFLISAKAGGQGINLTGANRVIILDTSWNPSNDQQNIFRIYRLGQERKCFVYRLLAMGTMEEKVYSRSVTKQAMSFRVVDEQQIDRHYNMAELAELYTLTKTDISQRPVPNLPTDFLLRSLLHNHHNLVYKYHEHDSLLENKPEQDLSEADKKEAWDAYENDLKTQRSTGFDQNALNASMMGFNNYITNPNLTSINYGGSGLPGRGYGANYTGNLNPSMSFLNQLSYQSGLGINQDPMMLMNQLYQSYPMGMGSSSMQTPYMGYMNQNSYFGTGMYPSPSTSLNSSPLGPQYKNLQSLAEIAMLPDSNALARSQSVSPSTNVGHLQTSTTSSPGLSMATTTTNAGHVQRNTPTWSMWNLKNAPSYFTPGITTATTQAVTQSSAKTTQATSTAISSTVQVTPPGISPQTQQMQVRQMVKTPIQQKTGHLGTPTSIVTSLTPSTAPAMSISTFTRTDQTSERPSSSTSPQPHVIMKATNTVNVRKDKDPPPPTVTKVTNMGIVYPTVEQRESAVPSLASLTPATITKIPTTTAQNNTPTTPKDPKAATLSLLGINAVLQNVTVTPLTKTTRQPNTTLTPIVTTTVKSSPKNLPGSNPKNLPGSSQKNLPGSSPKNLPGISPKNLPGNSPKTTTPTTTPTGKKPGFSNPAEIMQNLQNVTVKPTSTQPGKRQPYVYPAKGRRPIQINQRVVSNQTSITPISKPPPLKPTLSPISATLTRATVSQVARPTTVTQVTKPTTLTQVAKPAVSQVVVTPPSKAQGPHLTRISRLVPSTITTPTSTVHLEKALSGAVRPVLAKKPMTTPQLTVVRPGLPVTKTVQLKRPSVSLQSSPVGAAGSPKGEWMAIKRPSTTPIAELMANSKTISITQVKKPNLGVHPKPPIVPQSSATLQKITLPIRRTNKVPPTVLNKDPEIVELD
ncbi:transcriptional regulator ATRX-like isoform X2 [Phlebotomus papatasi]|uniref:transcriptional regulator ATRX-like isoform X2 n=1 Tax=Phlebotomus papatasi TaxID=29031 RepID=UPI002483F45C|nr:transcriptional regulator ATRX-like isoform X2 [Phlebotomus papatasi]